MTSFYIDQHGCAKNQTDGEIIVGFLEKAGYSFTLDPEKADFIIVNSCGFINSAKKESIDAVINIKNAYPDAKIILTGCLAERYADTLIESMPELDGIFGNGDLSKIAAFMDRVKNGERIVQKFAQCGVCSGERKSLFNFPGSAFVKITEGCSNHCSFCAIPIIRGELRSRSPEEIIAEIKDLVQNGIYEINLIGQDLAAFGTGLDDGFILEELKKEGCDTANKSPLSCLFELISKIEGNFIVRPLYIHPDHFNFDIVDAMKKDNRFVHYFDIPFQSGDDKIILQMNRTGSKKKYTELVNKIRSELSECMIRTTFLTGFPGEEDENAENTRNFLNKIQPDWSGCFPYSREEDTPAYDMKPAVNGKTAKKRAEALEKDQSEITAKRLERFTGKEVSVLIEEIIENDEKISEDASEGLAIGRAWFQAPEVDGCVVVRFDNDDKAEKNSIKPGNVVKVKILNCTGVDLDGRFLGLIKEFKASDKIHFQN